MKTKFFSKNFMLFFVLVNLLLSCVDDNSDFATPQVKCIEPQIKVTNTLSELKALAVGNIHQIKDSMVVEGYVVSSDEQGNFYASISIQNPEGTAGVKLSLDQRNIYTRLKVGQKVYLKAQNLFISNDGGKGDVALGTRNNDYIGRLPETLLDTFLIPSCEALSEWGLIHRITLNNLSDTQLNTLIEIDDVQFRADEIGGKYFDAANSIGSATNRHIIDKYGHELIVRNSEYSTFANDDLPSGNGKIMGVLSKFNGQYQLFIRTTNDVQFVNKRKLWGFASEVKGDPISISKLIETYKNTNLTITENSYIEGVITMSSQQGNVPNKNAFIQDDTGALALRFDKVQQLFKGYKVRIKVKGLKFDNYAGLIQLININQGQDVQVLEINAPMPTPKTLSIESLLNGAHQSEYVRIENVQFEQSLVTFSGDKFITDCSESISVFTNNLATFSNEIVPSGNGAITGIVSNYNGPQILLRSPEDAVNLNGNRCVQPEAFFSENFETLPNGPNIYLTGWFNIAEAGSKLWHSERYKGNTYAEFSPYHSKEQSNIGWLITPPIDMDIYSNEYLIFETAQHHFDNATLEVYISNDFDGNEADLLKATWTKINAVLASKSDTPYQFISSGKIDVSSYTGQIYLAFKYTGSGSTKSDGGFFVDNIKVFGK
jgi:Family of unknown function (DUF5689)